MLLNFLKVLFSIVKNNINKKCAENTLGSIKDSIKGEVCISEKSKKKSRLNWKDNQSKGDKSSVIWKQKN